MTLSPATLSARGARFHQFRHRSRHHVEDHQRVPSLEQVPGHGLGHNTETYKSNFRHAQIIGRVYAR
jgi:hypothetical protein